LIFFDKFGKYKKPLERSFSGGIFNFMKFDYQLESAMPMAKG